MGLFGRFKKEKVSVNWNNAYTATPHFYSKQDGTVFGAVALTEGTATILPKMPHEKYSVDGKQITEWRLMLVSTTKDDIIGDCDYFTAINKLEKYILDFNEKKILVKDLSLDELEKVAE